MPSLRAEMKNDWSIVIRPQGGLMIFHFSRFILHLLMSRSTWIGRRPLAVRC